MKKLFRAVSCCEADRCVSFSTLEKAVKKLEEWAKKYNHDLVEAQEDFPEDYGYTCDVKCWHNYIGISAYGIQYAYVVVEFKKEEE